MIRGSATVHLLFAYFTPRDSNAVYGYQCSTGEWEQLPPCPYPNSALVIIDGSLTAVGGGDGSHQCTNKLFTLRQRRWVEEIPPMPTARSSPAVVRTADGDYIFVIGGTVGFYWTATVKLFHVRNRKWCELTELPQPFTRPSATICGNQLHVIEDDGNGYSAQISHNQPITSLSWVLLPRLPVTWSTAATLCGQLVIIGGQLTEPVNVIHQLVNGEWVEIGSITYSRRRCLIANISPDKMIIVGGVGAHVSVEECTLST